VPNWKQRKTYREKQMRDPAKREEAERKHAERVREAAIADIGTSGGRISAENAYAAISTLPEAQRRNALENKEDPAVAALPESEYKRLLLIEEQRTATASYKKWNVTALVSEGAGLVVFVLYCIARFSALIAKIGFVKDSEMLMSALGWITRGTLGLSLSLLFLSIAALVSQIMLARALGTRLVVTDSNMEMGGFNSMTDAKIARCVLFAIAAGIWIICAIRGILNVIG
jgi:hypothetical protein